MTNATKASIIATVNPLVVLVVSMVAVFGVEVTAEQTAAVTAGITGFLNALFALWIALTYKNSAKRLPDFPDFQETEEPQ